MGLALPLTVLGVPLADDAQDASPLDHLTVLTDRADARTNLQRRMISGNEGFELSLRK